MSDLSILISGIEYKVRKLTSLLERCEAESKKLLKENSGLLEKVEMQKKQIQQLEEKAVRIQMIQALTSKSDVVSVKQKINELVREVDRCIALLNE